MAARKTRLNFTLSPENVRAAQEICDERGLKLSTFVDRAIAAYVKQLRAPLAPESPGERPSIDYKRWESQITGLIPTALETYLESHYGDNNLKTLFEWWTTEAIERAAPPTPPATSTPKGSQRPQSSPRMEVIDVPEETRERLKRYTLAELIAATGKDRGALSMIRTGKRARLQKDTYEAVLAGLEQLESQG